MVEFSGSILRVDQSPLHHAHSIMPGPAMKKKEKTEKTARLLPEIGFKCSRNLHASFPSSAWERTPSKLRFECIHRCKLVGKGVHILNSHTLFIVGSAKQSFDKKSGSNVHKIFTPRSQAPLGNAPVEALLRVPPAAASLLGKGSISTEFSHAFIVGSAKQSFDKRRSRAELGKEERAETDARIATNQRECRDLQSSAR